jgi:transcriptional regulator with XRE-family HTH domain
MTLGERVLVHRRRCKLSQESLADLAGINKMTIWRLEKGAITDVKGAVLGKLATALGVSADYLLGLTKEEHR